MQTMACRIGPDQRVLARCANLGVDSDSLAAQESFDYQEFFAKLLRCQGSAPNMSRQGRRIATPSEKQGGV